MMGVLAVTHAVVPRSAFSDPSAHPPIYDWNPLPPRVLDGKPSLPAIVGTSHSADPQALQVRGLVRRAVEDAGDFDRVIRRGDTVLIKPNLVYNLPSGTGSTTDIRVAGAVAEMTLDCGARRIIFAEGSAVNHPVSTYGMWNRERTERCFVVGGYADLAKKLGASLIDLNDAGEEFGGRELVREVHLPRGLREKSYWISKVFLDADRVISLPVLKNHELAGVTLSLKNYIGVAPADIYHRPGVRQGKMGLDHSVPGLAKTIADLVTVHPPDYAIVDGLVGVNTGTTGWPALPGPGGPMRAILAGRDPVAVDTVACLAMNYDPATIGHLVYASAVGLGISDPRRIEIRGAGIEPFRQDFAIPVQGRYTPGRYGEKT